MTGKAESSDASDLRLAKSMEFLNTHFYLGRIDQFNVKIDHLWVQIEIFFTLIGMFKYYFTLKLILLMSKLIPLRSKLINAQKMKKTKKNL